MSSHNLMSCKSKLYNDQSQQSRQRALIGGGIRPKHEAAPLFGVDNELTPLFAVKSKFYFNLQFINALFSFQFLDNID